VGAGVSQDELARVAPLIGTSRGTRGERPTYRWTLDDYIDDSTFQSSSAGRVQLEKVEVRYFFLRAKHYDYHNAITKTSHPACAKHDAITTTSFRRILTTPLLELNTSKTTGTAIEHTKMVPTPPRTLHVFSSEDIR
jgi:hypothetical protein